MNKIIKKNVKVLTWIFQTNDIHESYDFVNAVTGDVLISYSFIQKFLEFRILNINDIKKAYFLLELIENSEKNENSCYNLTVYIQNNVIKFEIGDDLYRIYENLEKYKEYLNDLQDNLIESYIEFQL